ncbi:RNA-binding protein 24/38 [Marchantia polymorpha subsp. ruderalis]|uniref:RRM domain-containing protein n=1 Tax=Marchantia polymorpha TaxID=3197 RepID=A0A2R6VZZ0_MARPO|nr:hypothetical protein MARPO_0216s0007 [Marchantia polymorpha]BBN18671.1 hypothetical protein Mp_8g04430 [Marchantia polymorpha subsp. ruderalis]|eukprot:PTQ27162.1 hypothetical protein MARPO_0216s0007 [Marchantia polymorpha]
MAAGGAGGGAGGGGGGGGQGGYGDTTYTKVFVGGLAWETQRDTMRRHFEQFGDILEAVVITDKNTGRSKGYGFVTFRDAEAARRACADATPIIDGRRANCNLASLGNRNRPHGQHGNRFRPMTPFPAGPQAGGPGYTGAPSFPQAGAPFTAYPQQGFTTYPQYAGYPQYPPDYTGYPQNLYSPYGGPQFPVQAYGPGSIANPATGLYPYSGFTQPLQGGPGYASPQAYTGVQGPPLMQYGSPAGVTPITSMAQQYPGTMTIPTASPSPGVAPTIATAGVGGPGPTQQFAVATPTQQQFSTGGVPEQPSG